MALKKFVPSTPAQRQLVLVQKNTLWKGKAFKSFVFGVAKTGGRNNNGHITIRHIGGGKRKKIRIIDFKRSKRGIKGNIERIEYDPNRSAFIALVKYEDNSYAYIIAVEGLNIGDYVEAGENIKIKTGNALPLSKIPIGSMVHNVELKPGKGGQLARSAGTYAVLVGRNNGYAQIKLRSNEARIVQEDCYATIGIVSNADHQNQNMGKAGRMRWKGIRPTVRGVAMNPVDHPHGGGEGKTSGGRHPVSPWGQSAKGKRTRSNKATDKFIVKPRYKK